MKNKSEGLYFHKAKINDVPDKDSYVLALYENGHYLVHLSDFDPWKDMIVGTETLGKIICWSYLPYGKLLVDYFREQ